LLHGLKRSFTPNKGYDVTEITSPIFLLEEPFGGKQLTVGMQSVLYYNDFAAIERSVGSLARAAEIAIASGTCRGLTVSYGDGSPSPCLTERQLGDLRNRFGHALHIEYVFFGENLGTARGHNRIASSNTADIFLIQNPDVVVSPRTLETMLLEFNVAGVGMVEAKQLPFEHPKEYDTQTGETSWASTASAMIVAPLFRAVGGFDADAFFLYCDDVDFSWQVRRAGFKVVFQPSAVVFHDKRLSKGGIWEASAAEQYYSAEAALLLAYKWSRTDLTERYLRDFKNSNNNYMLRAAEEFERRRIEGRLPTQLDADHKIGQFIDGMYARHRYAL
jgi:GT2 family glycosyltransferase